MLSQDAINIFKGPSLQASSESSGRLENCLEPGNADEEEDGTDQHGRLLVAGNDQPRLLVADSRGTRPPKAVPGSKEYKINY